MSAAPITAWQLAIASLLIVVTGGVSVALRLGLERSLGVAALRTVVQLLLIGYVLKWFSPPITRWCWPS